MLIVAEKVNLTGNCLLSRVFLRNYQRVPQAIRALYYYSEELELSKPKHQEFKLSIEAVETIEKTEKEGKKANDEIEPQIWRGLDQLDGSAFLTAALNVMISQGQEWKETDPMRANGWRELILIVVRDRFQRKQLTEADFRISSAIGVIGDVLSCGRYDRFRRICVQRNLQSTTLI